VDVATKVYINGLFEHFKMIYLSAIFRDIFLFLLLTVSFLKTAERT